MVFPHFGIIKSSMNNLLGDVIVTQNQVFKLSADLRTGLGTATTRLCTVPQLLFLKARNVFIGEIYELSIKIII
jgi:hypothetical protein